MTNLLLLYAAFIFFSTITLFRQSSGTTLVTYNVVNLGASPNGVADSTESFLRAWALACAASQAATIYVPPGRYLIGKKTRFFGGECKNKGGIVIRNDGVLVAPSDFRVIGDGGNWVLFEEVNGVSLVGGVLDAQGTGLWACKASNKNNCPIGATTLEFSNSKNIVISGLSSLNSQLFHIVINGCHNVKLQGVEISASANSPNTDGIHVQLSSFVTIFNTKIRTGDDCVSIGAGTTDLWIQNVACGPGHGISIGSLGKELDEAGVQNVTVNCSTFRSTQNGLRIKTWGRPSNGFVRGVLFQHALMVNVQNPIIIDQNYCPNNQGCPRQVSGVKISDVTYEDIKGNSATEVAVKFECSEEHPCNGIRLRDVNLNYNNGSPEATCANARGTASGLVHPASCL